MSLTTLAEATTAESERISHYSIIKEIGVGGMGEVFLAHDAALNRFVAIKRMLPKFAADPYWRKQFKREAQAAAALNHPGIVAIHEVGEDNGLPYFTMEYVDGETLFDVISEGRTLTIEAKVLLIAQLCIALSVAHQAGLVHGDIKPNNLMVVRNERLKILDFGLAKRPTVDSGYRDLAGNPRYMSPEQLRNEPLDLRSDVFAVGLVMRELLTGTWIEWQYTSLPYGSGDRALKPLHEVDPSLPPSLVRIAERAYANEKTLRYPDLTEMHTDLVRASDQMRQIERRSFTRRRLFGITSGSLILLLSGFGGRDKSPSLAHSQPLIESPGAEPIHLAETFSDLVPVILHVRGRDGGGPLTAASVLFIGADDEIDESVDLAGDVRTSLKPGHYRMIVTYRNMPFSDSITVGGSKTEKTISLPELD